MFYVFIYINVSGSHKKTLRGCYHHLHFIDEDTEA